MINVFFFIFLILSSFYYYYYYYLLSTSIISAINELLQWSIYYKDPFNEYKNKKKKRKGNFMSTSHAFPYTYILTLFTHR